MNTEVTRTKSLQDYLAAAKYRRLQLAAAFAAGFSMTLLLAFLLPAHYRSAGTILIEQQEMPQDFVRSTVTSYADERVQIISKRVMNTETLLGIIRHYDLYARQRATDTREALLERMRKDIGLKMISADVIDPRSGRPTSATIAFEVSYTSTSPDLAAKVANELTTLYLNENLNNRTQLARDATTFLESEADRLSHQIADLEGQLAEFKDKNLHKLPDLTPLNMQLLDRTEEDLRNQEARQTSLEQQKVFLEAQLAQLRPNSAVFSDTGERIISSADRLKMARSHLDGARARYGPDHPDIAMYEREVAGLEKEAGGSHDGSPPGQERNDLRRRLEHARAELADAEQRYGPDHPDRISLQREVTTLEGELAAMPADAGASSTAPVEADNPAYVQIQAQLSATKNDLAALQEQMAKLRAQIEEYQRNISLSPQVEKRYHELTRDYENARLKYAEVRSKQQEAKAAQNLEADRKGERFTLIDPPLPPERPVSPNRVLILALGLVLSVGLAVGTLMMTERFDTSIRGRSDLQELLGTAPLALVPYIVTKAEIRAAWRRMWATAGSAVAAVCVAVVLVHLFYRPLDVLWFSVSRRFGFG